MKNSESEVRTAEDAHHELGHSPPEVSFKNYFAPGSTGVALTIMAKSGE